MTNINRREFLKLNAAAPLTLALTAASGAPVPVPDFTGGKWKTKKPTFALET